MAEICIENYLNRLLGYAMSLTRHREEAHDLVQECILKALSAKRVPEEEAAYRAWLFRILRNVFLEKGRNEHRRASIIEVLVDEPEPDEMAPVLHDKIIVERVLQCLSPDHHEILALIDIAGFSYAEAAVLLGVPVGTIMSRISRARKTLQQHLTAASAKKSKPIKPKLKSRQSLSEVIERA